MIRIEQTWWHIEDIIRPADGKLFRQVMDINTDETELKIKLGVYFVKLKVINRYNGNQLGFIENDGFIMVKLGDLSDWPLADDPNIRHIKLEIRYIDIKPKFETNRLSLGYQSAYMIEGPSQPEFYITVPLGMKMRNKGRDTKLLFTLKSGIPPKIINKPLTFHKEIFIGKNGQKRNYNYLIDEKSYKNILNTPSTNIIGFKIYYEVINEYKFLFIPLFAILLLFLGADEALNGIGTLFSRPITNLTYIVILISFTTFYINLLLKGYEVPFNKFVAISIPVASILLIFSGVIKSMLLF